MCSGFSAIAPRDLTLREQHCGSLSHGWNNRSGALLALGSEQPEDAPLPRILLIEDDANVRMLMEHVLLRAEYEVDVTSTVEQAQAMLEARGYDLVIADGRLPDGSGLTL